MSALTDLFGQIADAIRAKSGGTAQIQASAFPTEIANISGGPDIGFYSSTSNREIVCPNLIGKTYYAVIIQENITGDSDTLICASNRRASETEKYSVHYLRTGVAKSAGLNLLTFDNTTGTLTAKGDLYLTKAQKYLVIGW